MNIEHLCFLFQLLKQINLEAVMADIETHAHTADRKLLGFLGCLAVMKNAYRWGAVPVTKEEKDRTILSFPPYLEQPIQRVRNGLDCLIATDM